MVTKFWCFDNNDTFFTNFKRFDVFELCDKIKQDFFIETFHEKLFHRRLKSQANIFYTAIYVIVNHLSESNSGWSVSKFSVFGSVRFSEFRFRFGSVSKPKITFGFRLANFGFRLTVSISRKKLRQNPTFFKQSQKVLIR